MKEISVQELKNKIDLKEDFLLIDVRTPEEFYACHLEKGILIPLNDIFNRTHEIPKEQTVIIYCRSGKRSATAVELLEKEFQFNNLYNLSGGILQWVKEIDDKMVVV